MISGVTASSGRHAQAAPAGNPAVWIAVGGVSNEDSPILMTTEDANAVTWVDRSFAAGLAAPSAILLDICYSSSLNRWVAVGHDGGFNFGDPIVIYSDDGGNTWTAVTADPATDFFIESVCWTGTSFIAVGRDSASTTPKVMSSSNGISWTQRTSAPATSAEWYGVRGITGLAVAVGGDSEFSGPRRLMTSTDDGASWSANTPAFTTAVFFGVVLVSGGTHVIVGLRNSATIPGIGSSTNGTSWTEYNTAMADHQFNDVAYNGTIYAVVGLDFNSGLEGRAASSPNGTTWTSRATDPVSAGSDGPNWLSVAAINGGGFVAVGRDNNTFTIPYIMYSADGLTWVARSPDPASGGTLRGIATSS